MHVVSYSDARNSLKAVLDRVVNDHAPTVIHRRDGGDVVLVSEQAYSSMVETMYLLSSPANAAHLMRSIEQDKQGQAERHALIAE